MSLKIESIRQSFIDKGFDKDKSYSQSVILNALDSLVSK